MNFSFPASLALIPVWAPWAAALAFSLALLAWSIAVGRTARLRADAFCIERDDARIKVDEQAQELERQVTAGRLVLYRRERIEAIVEALPDAMVFLDEEGKANWCNGKMAILPGVTPPEITGRAIHDWPVPEEVRRIAADVCLNRHGRAQSCAHFFPDADRERRITMCAMTVHAPRTTDRTLGTLLHIRETTNEWLAQKGRDEFISQVAHELKTPLGNVMLYGEQLREAIDPTNTLAVESANTVCDEADRMNRLISNLLDISRIEAGTLAPDLQRVRIHDLLEDCMDNIAYAAKAHGLTTKIQIPPDMSAVRMDKSLIRVAISNLLANAVKYNRPEGEVSLLAEETPEGVIIAVQDTGLGIATDDIPHLFEKYYRSNDVEASARGGHGLGLYLTKRIVDLHHGRITVTSQLGSGSRFQMILPTSSIML